MRPSRPLALAPSLLLLSLALGGCGAGAPPTPAPTPAPVATPAAITAGELRSDLFIFASDSFRGRETGTQDELRAARFIAERLQRAGVEPAGDSGYFQRYPLVRQWLGPNTRLTVTEGGRTRNIPLGAELAPLLSLGEGAPPPRLAVEGDLVFAGYGLSGALGRNDLASLGNLTGKVVVVVNAAPPGADTAQRAMLESQAMIAPRLAQLLQRGASGVIVLLTGKIGDEFAGQAADFAESVTAPEQAQEVPESARQFPMVLLGTMPTGPSPLVPAGWPKDDRAQTLQGRRFSARLDLRRDTTSGLNVVARVRGREEGMNRTYVAYGAHFDHIGIQPPVNGDSVANGADDDGSGSMGLLALARAFQSAPTRPRRSMLFVWHGGEEKGLLGSSYFTSHPTVPIDSIVAQINADMIGRNGPDSLEIIGPGAAPEGQSRVLGAIVDSVNAARPRPFTFLRTYDTPTDPERYYERSDHYNYAQKGIPIVFFSTGLHADYHKVSDEPQKIDYDKLAQVARLMYDVGVAVANRPTRPK